MTQEDLTRLFQSVQGFGFVDITRSNDCAGYKWTTKWLTGGDKPPLTVIIIKNKLFIALLNCSLNSWARTH